MMVVAAVVMALLAAVFGVAAGWLLRGGAKRRESQDADQADVTREILAQLHRLADHMAADVDQHNLRVREIGEQLGATDDPQMVVSAVSQIITANQQIQKQLDAAEEKLHHQASQLERHTKEARTDALTHLANRRVFDNEIKRAHAEFRDHGRAVTLMLADIDHFKRFNDTHGHQAGDDVLRGVARVLRKSIGKKGIVARYGGEEFAIIFPGSTIDDVRAVAEQTRAAIGTARVRIEGTELHVTASAGLAQLLPGESVEQLIARADKALYVSKDAGRDCSHVHTGTHCVSVTVSRPVVV